MNKAIWASTGTKPVWVEAVNPPASTPCASCPWNRRTTMLPLGQAQAAVITKALRINEQAQVCHSTGDDVDVRSQGLIGNSPHRMCAGSVGKGDSFTDEEFAQYHGGIR